MFEKLHLPSTDVLIAAAYTVVWVLVERTADGRPRFGEASQKVIPSCAEMCIICDGRRSPYDQQLARALASTAVAAILRHEGRMGECGYDERPREYASNLAALVPSRALSERRPDRAAGSRILGSMRKEYRVGGGDSGGSPNETVEKV